MLLQLPLQGKQHSLFRLSDNLSLEVSEEEEDGDLSIPPDRFIEGKVSVINQTL